jgi:anthranilate phosphoribosyltransferase
VEITEKLERGSDLTLSEATSIFEAMLDGQLREEHMEKVLIQLADKGETGDEIAAAARVLQDRAIRVSGDAGRLLDVVGTGGDSSGSFNISTGAAILCSLFLPVAKHGNRAVSSKSGSADVLEELRIPIDLDKAGAEQFLKKKNFVFLFAQKFHPAMKAAAPVRRRIGRRTIFNLLGPLCNPAKPDCQMIGVFSTEIMPTYMHAIEALGIPNVMLVSSYCGLDEVSLSANTVCYHKKGPSVRRFEFDPKEFGIYASPDAVKGSDPGGNARIMKEVFLGQHIDLRNALAINAAFALCAAEVEEDIQRAFMLATETIENGTAYAKLTELMS